MYESKIEKVPRGIQSEKLSEDTASSRNLVSTIGAQVWKKFSGLKRFKRRANTLEQCKKYKLAVNSHYVIDMIFIYKITKVNCGMLLHKNLNVTLAKNDAAVYTPCLGPHKKLILTAIVLKFS